MKADDYKIQNLLKEGQISLRAQNYSGPVVVGWGMSDRQMSEGEQESCQDGDIFF